MAVQLPPELEEQIAVAAEAEGLELSDFVRAAVEERLRQNNFARSQPRQSLSDNVLIERINQGFPTSFWQHYRALATKRDAGVLTSEEHTEIISLSDRMEARSVDRLRDLEELARRRGVKLEQLIQQFGLLSSSGVA